MVLITPPGNCLVIIFSLFLVLPVSVFGQANDDGTVAAGASLFALDNSTGWLSPSGDFAFGFRQLQSNSDLFFLCIWYAKIPDKTIVWCANDGQPAIRGSKLNLASDTGLLLTGPRGEQLWKPSEFIAGVVSNGVMSDDGNFKLQGSNSDTLWETFKDPTDTLLPAQTMNRGGVISSRQSQTNYSVGRFRFSLQQDGDLQLYTVNLPTENPNEAYYASKTTADQSNSSSAGVQLVFNQSGAIYVLRENDERFIVKEAELVSARDYYFRWTLDYDGMLTQYSHPKNSTTGSTWTPLWSIPDDICNQVIVSSGLGVCGYNSICTLKEDKRPTCSCPSGYSLLDPNDIYGDCQPDFPQRCAVDELTSTPAKDLYDVVLLKNTNWPSSDYNVLKPVTANECQETCLQDCMCAVAIFSKEACWKKKLPLANGRIDTNSQAFIKVRKGNFIPQLPPSSFQSKKKDQDTVIRVGAVLLGSSVLIIFVLLAAICTGFLFIYRRKQKSTRTHKLQTNLNCFTYQQLEEATDGFKEVLGRGTFGTVYKGVLRIDDFGVALSVAVKKLNCVVQDSEREFKNEVNVIGQTHHKNLVRLLGYCDEGQHRLLVYEFLSNGTLASFLFGDVKPSWKQRIEIANGIARGLLYLHEDCSSQIIHCDIKPQNIILDEYNNARISDFGLSKMLMMDQSQTHTSIRGTKGYVAPEWFMNMPITAKVDVYSFGVVLLEIICCRKNVDVENVHGEEKGILTYCANDCYQEGALDVLIYFDEVLENRKQLKAFVMVALWCIQENPCLRPTMRKVVQMLEGVVEVLEPPCPCPCPCPSPYSTITIPIPSQMIN